MPPEDSLAGPAKRATQADAEISFIEPPAPDDVEIPEQKAHYQLPTRFGAVPVDDAPLGWEVETRRLATTLGASVLGCVQPVVTAGWARPVDLGTET